MVFIILGIIFIASSWLSRNKERTTFYSPWISFILIYFALHFGWMFLKPLFINDARGMVVWNMWTIIPTINVFLGIIMVQTLVEYTDDYQRWINVAKVLVWLGFGLSCYGLLQHFGLDQIFKNTRKLFDIQVVMFFGNPMLAGHFLAIIAPLPLMFKGLRYILIYLTMGIVCYLTGSDAAIGVFVFSSLVFLALSHRWGWLISYATLALCGGLWQILHKPSFLDLSGRLLLWKGVLNFCKEAPLTGFGLGHFFNRHFNPDPEIISWAHTAHNEFLEILHDWGIVGLVLVVGYLFFLFRRLRLMLLVDRSIILNGFASAFIGYLLIAQVGFPLRIAPLALIGILYIACLEVHCSRPRKEI